LTPIVRAAETRGDVSVEAVSTGALDATLPGAGVVTSVDVVTRGPAALRVDVFPQPATNITTERIATIPSHIHLLPIGPALYSRLREPAPSIELQAVYYVPTPPSRTCTSHPHSSNLGTG